MPNITFSLDGAGIKTDKFLQELENTASNKIKVPLPQVGEVKLDIPPFFAQKDKKGIWRLVNPLTLVRNLATRKGKKSIAITRENVEDPKVGANGGTPAPPLSAFSQRDQQRIIKYFKGVKSGSAGEYQFKNKQRGFPATLYKNAEKAGLTRDPNTKTYAPNKKKGRPAKATAPPTQETRGRPPKPPVRVISTTEGYTPPPSPRRAESPPPPAESPAESSESEEEEEKEDERLIQFRKRVNDLFEELAERSKGAFGKEGEEKFIKDFKEADALREGLDWDEKRESRKNHDIVEKKIQSFSSVIEKKALAEKTRAKKQAEEAVKMLENVPLPKYKAIPEDFLKTIDGWGNDFYVKKEPSRELFEKLPNALILLSGYKDEEVEGDKDPHRQRVMGYKKVLKHNDHGYLIYDWDGDFDKILKGDLKIKQNESYNPQKKQHTFTEIRSPLLDRYLATYSVVERNWNSYPSVLKQLPKLPESLDEFITRRIMKQRRVRIEELQESGKGLNSGYSSHSDSSSSGEDEPHDPDGGGLRLGGKKGMRILYQPDDGGLNERSMGLKPETDGMEAGSLFSMVKDFVAPAKKKAPVEQTISNKELQDLLAKSYEGGLSDYGDYKVDRELSNPISQVYYHEKKRQPIVVHRGSAEGQDWAENARYGLFNDTSGEHFKKAEETQRRAEQKYGTENLTTIGHSKGATHAEEYGKRGKQIITLNKPVSPYDLVSKVVPENQIDIKTSGDPVSALRKFQSGNEARVLESKSYNPLAEHSTSVLEGTGIRDNLRTLYEYMRGRPTRRHQVVATNDLTEQPARGNEPASRRVSQSDPLEIGDIGLERRPRRREEPPRPRSQYQRNQELRENTKRFNDTHGTQYSPRGLMRLERNISANDKPLRDEMGITGYLKVQSALENPKGMYDKGDYDYEEIPEHLKGALIINPRTPILPNRFAEWDTPEGKAIYKEQKLKDRIERNKQEQLAKNWKENAINFAKQQAIRLAELRKTEEELYQEEAEGNKDLFKNMSESDEGEGKGLADKIDFEDIKWGSFTEQFKRFKQQHPKSKVKDLGSFADMILSNPKDYAKRTIKRARFYKNVLHK